jgi:hypothetical protein
MNSQAILQALVEEWGRLSRAHFGGLLRSCTIRLEQPPGEGDALGCFSRNAATVWIHPQLVDGSHPELRGGTRDPRGLGRYLTDILAHEAIHAHVRTILRDQQPDPHGALFLAECRRITPSLEDVRRSWPSLLDARSCAAWPSVVRKKSYYQGAVPRYAERWWRRAVQKGE